MPLRYLVLVGRRHAPIDALAQRIAERSDLSPGFSQGRVAILTTALDGILPFADDRGAIIGTLFPRGELAPRIRGFDGARDPGRSPNPLGALLDAHWGAYLSVTFDGDTVIVARDPSGLLPCLYFVTPDAIVFGSDAALLEEAGLLSASVSWSALGRLLYANELPQQRTAFSGVMDLHAGTSLRISSGRMETAVIWSPWTFCAADPGMTVTDVAAKAEETIDRCVGSWASDHDRVVVAVSGGLDSSIVASSLAQARDTSLSALTISTQDSRGDESAYAQALCTHLKLDLTCGHYQASAVDIATSASAHLARPAGRAPTLAYDAVVHGEMSRLNAGAFFTGSGGDNIFYSTQSVRALVDRYLGHGLHWGLVETARDISRLTDASLWSVLRFAARVPREPGLKYRWPGDLRFLSDAYAEANLAIPLAHPWLDAPPEGLPGKASHVAMILRAQHYLDNYDRRLSFTAVHPLLSQPIVELMLAMPTWLAVKDGRDRAVARRAFSARFPPIIAERRIKGGPDAFAAQLMRANLSRARERLLDGAMCRQGLLDRKAVDHALTEAALSRGHDYVRLLLLLDTEAWIDTWTR